MLELFDDSTTHPVPDGRGQILLSSMDTWVPERQLSKSCVRLASKTSHDLSEAAKAFLSFESFGFLPIHVSKHGNHYPDNLCFLMFSSFSFDN